MAIGGDSYVLTPEISKFLSAMSAGENLWTRQNINDPSETSSRTKIVKLCKVEINECYHIRTVQGKEILCSPKQIIPTIDGMKYACELTKKDVVVQYLSNSYKGQDIVFKIDEKNENMSEAIPEDLSYLLGFIARSGIVNFKEGIVSFTSSKNSPAHIGVYKKISEICLKYFGRPYLHPKIQSFKLTSLLSRNKLLSTRDFFDLFLVSKPNILFPFLGGVFDGGGTIGYTCKKYFLYFRNKSIAQFCLSNFLSLDVLPTLRTPHNQTKEYELAFCYKNSQKRFFYFLSKYSLKLQEQKRVFLKQKDMLKGVYPNQYFLDRGHYNITQFSRKYPSLSVVRKLGFPIELFQDKVKTISICKSPTSMIEPIFDQDIFYVANGIVLKGSSQVKIFLDDTRSTPDGWVRCFTPAEVISLLENESVSCISLDHDLGLVEDGREITGYDVLTWIEEQIVLNGFEAPTILIHSDNGPAIDRMRRAVEKIKRLTNSLK